MTAAREFSALSGQRALIEAKMKEFEGQGAFAEDMRQGRFT